MITNRHELVDQLRGDDRVVVPRMRTAVRSILGPRWQFSAGTQNLVASKTFRRELVLRGEAEARYLNYVAGDGLEAIKCIFKSPRMNMDARDALIEPEEKGIAKGVISITLCPIGVNTIPEITYEDIGSMIRTDLALEEGGVVSLGTLNTDASRVLLSSRD